MSQTNHIRRLRLACVRRRDIQKRLLLGLRRKLLGYEQLEDRIVFDGTASPPSPSFSSSYSSEAMLDSPEVAPLYDVVPPTSLSIQPSVLATRLDPKSTSGSLRANQIKPQGTHPDSIPMDWNGTTRQVIPGSWVANLSHTVDQSDEGAYLGIPHFDDPQLVVQKLVGRPDWFHIQAPQNYGFDHLQKVLSKQFPLVSLQPELADYSAKMIPSDLFYPAEDGFIHNIQAGAAWGQTLPNQGSTAIVVAVNDTGVDYTHPDLYRNIWLNQSEIPVGLDLVDKDGDGLITFWDLNDAINADEVTDLNDNGYIDAGDLLRPFAEGGWNDGVDGGGNGYVDDLVGWDFAHDDNDPFPYDEYYENMHGTHVAGAVGSTGDDHTGIAGVVWKTQLMLASGLDELGFGTDITLSGALDYAVANGAHISNASWSGPYSELIDIAVQDAEAGNHLVIAASGNDGLDNDATPDNAFPSALPYDNIISVSGVDEFDFPIPANYGAISVDLAAPSFLLSTVPTWYLPGQPAYEMLYGTSQSTSLVTGAAALLWSTHPSATLMDIRDAILAGVDLLPDLDPATGFMPVASGGRLNVYRALQELSPNDLFVVSAAPNESETVIGVQPSEYSITFSQPVALSNDIADLQATDFRVGGVPANSVVLSGDGRTATFSYTSPPITTDGIVGLGIAPDAVRRADHLGGLSGGYRGTFRYDQILLDAESVEPAEGHTFETADLYTFHIHFNEPIDLDSLFRSPYEFSGFGFYDHIYLLANGVQVSWLEATLSGQDLELIFPSPFDGEGEFNLVLEANALTDMQGNPNDEIFLTYYIDRTTEPYPVPFANSAPLGSGIALGAPRSGFVNAGMPQPDTDDFTLDLDIGQSLTVQIYDTDTIGELGSTVRELRPSLRLYDPNNTLIASGDAATVGGRVVLQSIPIVTAGKYTIRVSGANGTTGRYQMQALLNAALETEGRLFRTSNDLAEKAQSIEASFQSFSTSLAHVELAAVSGALGTITDGIPNATVLFAANFETGTDGFTFTNDFGKTGLWNRTDRRGNEPGHSATHSLWYGNSATGTYDLGGAGSVVSPAITLPNSSTPMTFDFNYFLESDHRTDFTVSVLKSLDGGVSFFYDRSFPADPQTEGAWTKSSLFDLSAYKGNLVKIAVGFFTAVGFDPTLEGVYIDDLKIYQNAPSVDYYAFTGRAGEKFGFDIVQFSGVAEPDLLKVELIGADKSTVLATSAGGATNMVGAVNGLTVPSNGIYYLRVTSPRLLTGQSGIIFYNLLVTRNAVFDLELNSSAATAQPLLGTAGALGYIESLPSNAVDSGWYNSTGAHTPTNTNYIVGQSSGVTYRDWFVFDVPASATPVTSASIAIFNPSNGYASPDANETYKLFDIATPITTLRSGGTGLTTIFDDLGSGVEFGSVVITPANNGSLILINLNAAGLAAVQAARGGQLAFGGAITSLSGASQQLVFAFSSSTLVRTLIINGSPEPADWYSLSLDSEQTALRLETRTVGDGPGEIRNTLNPSIELYNQDGTIQIASGQAIADGRNELILFSGLTPNSSYRIKVVGEGRSVGEYLLTATPLVVPKVASPVTVGDGTNQRSNAKSLTVSFDGIVEIANLNSGTFIVKQRGPSGGIVNTTATAAVINHRTIVTLTFSGQFAETSGSLKDGNYDLKIDASRISRNGLVLDGDRDGTAGGDFYFGADSSGSIQATDNFFRMFGDSDGDRDVDDTDRDTFNLAFRKPLNNFTAIFDFDGDLDVDGQDLSQFSRRFRKTLAKI